MKIAFLLLAHHNPQNLRRMIHALDDPRFDFFVHVDAKADINCFQFDTYDLRHSRLILVPQRIRGYWADISLLDIMMACYHCAMAESDYDWFVTLSGEDYPIRSNDVIAEYFSRQTEECIRFSLLPTSRGVSGYWFRKIPDRLLVLIIARGLHMLGIRKKTYLTIDGKRWEARKSSQWHALTRESVRHILNTMDKYPAIRQYFKYSHAPDETVIPTILFNAPTNPAWTPSAQDSTDRRFEDRAVLHFLEYKPQQESTVTIFDESAYHEAVASGKLFIRKVRTGKSDTLLDMLDEFRKSDGHDAG